MPTITIHTPDPDVTGGLGFTCTPWVAAQDLRVGVDGIDPELLADCCQAASDILFLLSGSQYPGICTDVVRPTARRLDERPEVSRDPGMWGGTPGWYPSRGPSGWPWGYCTCNRETRTGCYPVPQITLGGYPVVSVTEVLIDGAVLDPSLYEVLDHRWLLRRADSDGTNPGWPCCTRIDLPVTEPQTWQVTYTFGALPVAAFLAGVELAGQLALAFAHKPCQLPQRVTNITSQGVTAVVLDPLSFIDKGRTGLVTVDYFLEAVNPGKLRRRATVSTPDIGPRVQRRTWP